MACFRGACRLLRGRTEAETLAAADKDAPRFDGCGRPPESLAAPLAATAPQALARETQAALATAALEEIHVSNPGRVQDSYAVEKVNLGTGAFSFVCRGTSRATGVRHAVKTISRADLENTPEDFQRLRREIELTRVMDHDHVVKLVDVFADNSNFYLIMELCSGGELFDRVVDVGLLTELQASVLMQQICLTVCYIHSRGICHRDLKPEHVIFVAAGPIETTPVKVIDFGLSCRFKPGEVLKTAVGTPSYVAPEVIKQAYSQSCDLWSFGVMLYCLLCGCLPFSGATARELVKSARKGKYSLEGSCWEPVSEGAKGLIRALLLKDPHARLTAAQVLEHEWIRKRAPQSTGAPLGPHVIDNLKDLCSENKRARALLQEIKSAGHLVKF